MLTRRAEYRLKHESVIAYLETHGLDGVVLTRRANFAWFTAGGLNHVGTAADVGAASLVVTRNRVVCITNNIESPRLVVEELEELGIDVRSYDWWDDASAERVWSAELGVGAVSADAPIPAAGREVPLLGATFDRLRYQLNEAEIERYRKLGPEVAESLESACRQAHPGMTEHELGALIAAGLVAKGIRPAVILIANEDRICLFRHPLPTNAPIRRYGMGVCGGERDGLYISVSRLFSFGPIDDDLQRRHVAVSQIEAAMIAATRPGATLGDIFAVCQKTYADGGFADEWKLHHQGGATGYAPRDNRAFPGSTAVVLPSQAYAWNPSITGTKSEDTILALADRTEVISATGSWPTRECSVGGMTIPRNEILRL